MGLRTHSVAIAQLTKINKYKIWN